MYFEYNITAFKHVPFGGDTGDGDIIREGVDWSAAAFTMAIAPHEGDAASKTINSASAGSEGISATYDANYVNDEGTQVGATTIRIYLLETSMETLGAGTFFYDLLVTPSGQAQRVLCRGSFTVLAGVAD